MNEPPQTNDHKRIGIGMVVAGWVLGLALLTWLFGGALDRQHNPNAAVSSVRSEQTVEVVLLRNRFGHYVATGQINDRSVNFMLDTGATDISIPASVAEQLGLQRGPAVTYNTANGPIRAYSTILESVRLGDIELRQLRASINPNVRGDDEILLGMSFLKHLEFTQSGNTLTLRQSLRP